MHPSAFSYLAPGSLDEAVEMLAAHPRARVLAGGQSLLALMKLRLAAPEWLVDLGRVPGIDGITRQDGTIRLGAMATHAATAASHDARVGAAALADAAAVVGDPLVRNRGTVGGSAAHADPVGDEPGALLALGAAFTLRGPDGGRTVAADEFFRDAFTTALEPGEIVSEVSVPAAAEGEASAYVKIGRRGGQRDYPVAGAAVWLRMEDDVVADCRIALTGAALSTTRLPVAERALIGGGDAASLEDLDVTEGVTVVGDLYGSADYKTHLSGVIVRRTVERALHRLH
jgi:carbon-monoxide dehydrogenase medium subunit